MYIPHFSCPTFVIGYLNYMLLCVAEKEDDDLSASKFPAVLGVTLGVLVPLLVTSAVIAVLVYRSNNVR